MQKSILGFLLICSIKINAQENKFNATSEVKKVTVFLTGAELNHEVKIKLKKGKNIVTFTGLSPRLDERSINLTPGSSEVNVLYINTHTNYLDEKKDNEKIQNLKDSVMLYKDKLALLKFEQDALETEKSLLFKNQSIGGQAGVSIADVEKSADFYRKRSTEINQLIFKNNKVKVKYDKQRSQYQKQLVELDAEVNPPTSDITATFVANKDIETTITFKYLIPTAGWTPKYDIRTEGTGKEVTLVYRAILFNNSGLDWKDIKIILSTANPDIGINIPKLSKWYLGNEQVAEENNIAQYVQVLPGVVNSESKLQEVQILSEEEQEISKKVADKKAKQNQIQFKKIEVDMLSTEYTIEQPYTVYSDSKPYTVDVLEKTVNAYYEYKAVPALDKDVFLQTKLALKDLPDLVSGDASVYFGGSYIGKTFIKTIDLDDSLTISLGRDKKIQMVRKESKQDYQRSIVGNYEKEVLKYETTIKNTRDIPVSIIVEDQIPVASNSDQEINVNEISGATFDKASGKLTWKIVLNPNESKVIKMGYSSKYPKSVRPKKKKFRTISSPSF
ncbi:MAG: hypothetical protein C0448_08690 [Sphingobacteriaceae bacterium]|nr:hypothetical protein [Sphingobacteriaceae bacterium]